MFLVTDENQVSFTTKETLPKRSSYEAPQLVRLPLDRGFAQSGQQAAYMLLILSIAALLLAAFIFFHRPAGPVARPYVPGSTGDAPTSPAR